VQDVPVLPQRYDRQQDTEVLHYAGEWTRACGYAVSFL
jgi:hypothetical protein